MKSQNSLMQNNFHRVLSVAKVCLCVHKTKKFYKVILSAKVKRQYIYSLESLMFQVENLKIVYMGTV